MRKIYGFTTEKEALWYAEKNLFKGTYNIRETNRGGWCIIVKDY